MATKRYLGDGVFVSARDNGDLVLTTENGMIATNRIVLEPKVALQLAEYVAESLGITDRDGRMM